MHADIGSYTMMKLLIKRKLEDTFQLFSTREARNKPFCVVWVEEPDMELIKLNTTGAISIIMNNMKQWLDYDIISSTSASALGTLILTLILYWLFCVPYNWTKCLEDVSYEFALKNERRRNRSSGGKKDAINRMRRLRAIGIKDLPPPFPNGWYCLIESSALKPGEVTSVSCLGEHFVVYRTLERRVYVLDAYCPHLGANMGVGGRVVGDSIECPFHQWSFRGSDGRCDNIPYSSCALQSTQVKKWISREVNDNIFVWYHAENEDPWELPVVMKIENKELLYHGRNEFYVNCHIQEIPENGADLAHFTAIHKASLFAGGEDPRQSPLANAGLHHWQAVWKPDGSANKHLASVTLKHYVELLPKLHVFCMDVVGQQIGPAYVQLHMKSPTFGHIEVLQTVTPVEPLVQKVVHRFYAHKGLGPIMKLAIFGESVMFERDMTMWNHKMFRNKPQLVKEDASLKSFRSWFSQFYTANSKSFAEARDNMDW